MAMNNGTKTQAIGAVSSIASSFISTWGAYSANKIAIRSANKLADIQAKTRGELAAINNIRVGIQTDLELYMQAEEFERARTQIMNKSIEVQTAILKAKGEASAKTAFTGVHGNTSDIEANLIDIKGAKSERAIKLEMEELTRQNALAVGNTLLSGSRQMQQTQFIADKQVGPSGTLAIGGALSDASSVMRSLQRKD